MRRVTVAALAAICVLASAACEKEAPSPWKEMKLPLRHGEILPGADAENLRVQYQGTDQRKELFREFRRQIEAAGYTYDREGKGHDPPGNAFAGVFKQGAVELLLSVSGAGGTKTNVEIKRLD
jgi:hypothetical protein